MTKVKVTQPPEKEKEVPTEVLATSIVAISEGIRRLRSGRLSDRALFLLVQDAAPAVVGKSSHSRLSMGEIKAVFAGIENLEAAFIKKLSKPAHS